MSGKAIIKPLKGTIKVIKATGPLVSQVETPKKTIDDIDRDEIDIEFDDAEDVNNTEANVKTYVEANTEANVKTYVKTYVEANTEANNSNDYRENNLDNEEEEDIDRLLLKSREESTIDNASTIIILPVKTVKKKTSVNKLKSKNRPVKSKLNTLESNKLESNKLGQIHESNDNKINKKTNLRESFNRLKSERDVKTNKHIQNNVEDSDNSCGEELNPEIDPNSNLEPNHEQSEPDSDAEPNLEQQEKPPKKTRKKTTTKKTAVKKGPGRPRKIPKKEPMPRNGIKSTSINPDSYIEFLYDTPIYIKKLLGIFKSLAASKIQIVFRPTDIILYATDHHKKSRMRIRIDASKLNHYYCKNVLDIGILEKDLELIMNKVDSGYSSIVLVSTNGNTQKNITLILENDIQIDENHTIELIGQYDRMDNEAEFTDENYAIKFSLPGKYFRKTISDIKTMSNQISITQEDTDSPLVFEYSTENGKIHSRHTVNNPDKIKLKSQPLNGESFRVDMKVDYIKPISSAHISDEIMILVDENKKFMTKAFVDNGTIEIKTITEIIDSRKPVEET